MELAKIRAYDKLQIDTGIEEDELMVAFFKHNIMTNPGFKKIIDDCKAKVQQSINDGLAKLVSIQR